MKGTTMSTSPILERQMSGYGSTETAMAARVTRTALNAECDFAWKCALIPGEVERSNLALTLARIRDEVR
jgi:hypothetical protein